ncbi:hypothetical protein FGIG_02496 [Fasciola gigantica]|uniref:Uncharacterized protein n=1 Tax=Fasciola gigantica TaxID=46835 RepID=A0A504YXS4_FASGI|nr:hypothetical protein FGIG_02496 [Fasciola gigantica]
MWASPTPAVPLNMWLPGVFPTAVPKLGSKQAIVLNKRDRFGKPPVMQDLSLPAGHLDMDDEFSVPYVTRLSIQDPDLDSPDEDTQTAGDYGEDELVKKSSDRSKQTKDRILSSNPVFLPKSGLLSGYGYGYGTSAGVALVPLMYKTYQAPAVIPLALAPVIRAPQKSQMETSSPAFQPTLTHSQQTITINAQVPQQLQQQHALQQQQPQLQLQPQQSTNGQGRMSIPQISQPFQPPMMAQPQQFVQPTFPSQSVLQPAGTLPAEGRFQWPTSVNSQPQTVQTVPAQQVQTQQQQLQQQQVSRKITVTHKVAPQHIRIVLPKTYKRYSY